MAPPKKAPDGDKDQWWRNAYPGREDIFVSYEMEFGKDVVRPGTPIKIKYQRGVFRFRCLAHNIKLDSTWIDCIHVGDGSWHSFRVEQIRGVVKPKRSRRKKPIT